MTRLPSTARLVALACLLAACSSRVSAVHPLPTPTATPTPTTRPSTPSTHRVAPTRTEARPVAAALHPFRDCRALVSALRAEALQEVTAYGLPQPAYGGVDGVVPVSAPMAAAASGSGTAGGTTGGSAPAAAPAAAPGAAQAFSGTNNQEAGVDEPDVVKTDGTLLLVLRQQEPVLEVLDVSGGQPRQLSSIRVGLDGGPLQLLFTGRTAVVLGQRSSDTQQVVVAEVYSLTDPAHPTHLRTFRVDGALLDARFVHGRVLLVTRSAPAVRFSYPSGPGAEAAALAHNRAVVRVAGAGAWLPSVRVSPHGRSYPAQCTRASHPGVASGTSTTSIVTLDPATDAPTSNRTVVGGSDLLYASSKALYLATSSWQSQRLVALNRTGETTDLHGFDITDPDAPRYLGSGSLPGTLVDRYALSEQDGYLRVATTLGTPVPPVNEGAMPTRDALSDNRVTVLQPVDGVLQKVGEVRGLGRGQRIFGVRFLGDVGYVVTFRQLDPLYALDLSDPRRPRLQGALHISGYSSALYPLSDGRLLGVGAAVGAHQEQLGAQAEVFDVRRLARPRLTGKLVWTAASTPAAQDHHALLWWAPSSLVVLPLDDSTGDQVGLVLRVGATGSLTEIGRISAPGDGRRFCCTTFDRAVVVGHLLYSVTDDGIVTNPLDEVTHQRWFPFH